MYVRNKQEFQHYDSMSGSNREIAHTLAYRLQPFVQGMEIICLFIGIPSLSALFPSTLDSSTLIWSTVNPCHAE